MTPKERYMACILGEQADCLARVPILMQFAAEYIGSNYGEFASDFRVLSDANLRCAKDFGFDQLSAISDPYRETADFGGEITFVKDGVPRCAGPLEEDDEIYLEKLTLPDPLNSKRMKDRIDAVRFMHNQAGEEYSIMGWVEGPAAEAADLRGVSNFFMDLLDDEEASGALMDLALQNAINFATAQVEAGADTIGIGEAIASQVSAEVYADMILPRTSQLVHKIREAGAYVKLHICGNITHILKHIRTMPINAIDLDHFVDPSIARKVLGPNIAICTNLDPTSEVQQSDPDSIRSAVIDRYQTIGNPCLVNAGCEIPSGTPAENLSALCTSLSWKKD